MSRINQRKIEQDWKWISIHEREPRQSKLFFKMSIKSFDGPNRYFKYYFKQDIFAMDIKFPGIVQQYEMKFI